MALFGGKKGAAPKITKAIDPKWAKSPKGSFNRLLHFEPSEANIRGVGGVYVVWHGGVKPSWVYAAETPDLARSINEAIDNDDITEFEVNGSLYVTWSPVLEEYRRGVLLFLTQSLKPEVRNPLAPTEETDETYLIPVLLPGEQPKEG
ncbi:MAG: hypothetical protein HON14_03980 [Rhodospirillaceae bacterium]|jgi:hypothetical protein|nr:hypothetical protein [Rhodospirillaceae bacterium]MBT4589987.1 hypothetical protein [Rhodospirillaceae bacterium]MBT4938268.1 hypothetical protein [Rhodospirillaceae bacterium]MBT5941336.1 hypothetical protein [Rhodospirillaceae bacterium]MBT7268975.1 hypothetical protein [Rhodospirillaceae bacterium]